MYIDKPIYSASVQVIKLVDGDDMVWAIRTFARISKQENTSDQCETHQNRLETTTWSVCVRADLCLWL